MANISITSSSTVLYGGSGGEAFGLDPRANYVYGGGGNDVFQGSTSYTALYSGGVGDYAFSSAIGDDGSRILFVQDLRLGAPDGVDRYVGNGSLGFGFKATGSTIGQTIDQRSAADLLAALPANPNQLPIAFSDSISLTEDTALRFNAVQNDRDPETDPLRAVGVFNPAGNLGSASLDVDGQITYSAIGKFEFLGAGQTAQESFNYVVSDGRAGSDEGRVDVTITGVNDAPIARPDLIALSQDQARTFNPLTNDDDPDQGDKQTLKVVAVSGQPGNQGLVTIGDDGQSLTYTAANRFNTLPVGQTTTETFTYTVRDKQGATSQAQVNVTITGENDTPVVVNDAISLSEDQALKFNPSTNDTDPDQGDSVRVSAVAVTQPERSNGEASVNGAGEVTYSAIGKFDSLAQGQTAQETITYTAVDGRGASSTGSVAVTVTGVNDAPVAVDDAIIVSEDSPLLVNPAGNDPDVDRGDTVNTVSVSNPAGNKGVASLVNGQVQYNPNGAFEDLPVGATATESFTYEVADSLGAKDQGRVNVTIQGVNDAPVAVADTATVSEDGSIEIHPERNDRDVDRGDVLRVADVTNPSTNKGQVTFTAGQVIYNAAGRFDDLPEGASASESFSYKVSDGNGGVATSQVSVAIRGVNDAPKSNPDAYGVSEGDTITVNPALNDTDVDRDDTRSVTQVSGRPGARGAVSLGTGGNVTYSAQDGFDALARGEITTETFDYTVSDKLGATDRGQATVTVTGVNDAPVASDDRLVLSEEQILEAADGLLLANDRDVDHGDVLKVAAVTDNTGNRGALSYTSATGRVVYNPVGKFDDLAEGQSKDVSFSYTVADRDGATHQAQVKVTVTGVNDAPVAVDDRATISQGASHTFNPAGNDTDVDLGDTRRVTSVSNPTGNRGTATLNSISGEVSYASGSRFNYLADGESASETYSYTVADRFGGTDRGDVTITVTGINDAPEAVNDVRTLREDEGIRFNPAENDRDVDNNDILRVSSAQLGQGAKGSLEISQDGSLYYSAAGKFDYLPQGSSAIDTITYTVSDKLGAQSVGRVDVAVTGVNDAPVSARDQIVLTEDEIKTGVSELLLANDTDVDLGDRLTVASFERGSVADGALRLVDGQLSFTAAGRYDSLYKDQEAKATFSYIAKDLFGSNTDRATVDVTIKGINDAPGLKTFAPLTISEGGNDVSITIDSVASDVDAGDAIRFNELPANASWIAGTAGGRFMVADRGTAIHFDPGTDFEFLSAGDTLTSSYSFSVHDLYGAVVPGRLDVVVTGVNDAPVLTSATPITYRVGEDFTTATLDLVKEGKVSDVDRKDQLTIKTLSSQGLSTEVVDLQPVLNQTGLTLTRTNGLAAALIKPTDAANFNFTVGGVAYNQYDRLDEGESAFEKVTFEYQDQAGLTVSAPVTLEIQGRNDAPIRQDGQSSTDLGWQPLTTATRITQAQLLGTSFYDVDGEALSVSKVEVRPGSGGSITAVAGRPGEWDYMPGRAGNVELAFTVTDGTALLVSSANFVVKEPFLADVKAGFKMLQASDGSWEVQRFSEQRPNGSAASLVDVPDGTALNLNDARGNDYISAYLPEGYNPVGFDADWIAAAPGQSGGHWQFDLILRGDDPVSGDSVYRLQRFEDTGAALRNTSLLSDVDVVMLETELYKEYSDTDNWRQVDINGDGVMGLNFNGPTLASSGDQKLIDGGSGLLLNRQLLTNADGSEVFALDGYKAAAISADGTMTQILFQGGSAASPSYLAQSFDQDGHAVGSVQAVPGLNPSRTVQGTSAADVLFGGVGSDTIKGGAGADQFVFDQFAMQVGTDRLVDFNGLEGDSVALSSAFTGLAKGTALSFVTAAKVPISDGDLSKHVIVDTMANIQSLGVSTNGHLAYATDTGQLLFDANGNWSQGNDMRTIAVLNNNGAGANLGAEDIKIV